MAVIRPALPDLAWTAVPNAWLRDPKLPPAPKAYLAYLLSHREGYKCSTSQAAREMGVGRDTVAGWNRKLAERGYFVAVEQPRTEGGRWAENDYTITSCTSTVPPAPELPENPTPSQGAIDLSTVSGKPGTVAPGTVDPTHRKTTESETTQEDQQHPAAAATGDGEPTPQQRARALAGEHHDAVGGMAPYMGVVKIVERALTVTGPDGEPRYSDERVAAALAVLRDTGRPVTLQTLHAALETPQTVGARRQAAPYRDPDPADYRQGF